MTSSVRVELFGGPHDGETTALTPHWQVVAPGPPHPPGDWLAQLHWPRQLRTQTGAVYRDAHADDVTLVRLALLQSLRITHHVLTREAARRRYTFQPNAEVAQAHPGTATP